MIYNANITISNEYTQYLQMVKIEANSTEELFEKIIKVSFLFDGFLESVNITQEMKKDYNKRIKSDV